MTAPTSKGGGNFWEQDDLVSPAPAQKAQQAPAPMGPTTSFPVFDAMGNATGFEEQVSSAPPAMSYGDQMGNVGKFLDDRVRQLANGVTLGAMDEVAAGLDSVTGRAANYDGALKHHRDRDAEFAAAHPYETMALKAAGTIGGMVATGVPSLVTKGGSFVGRMGLGALEGAGWGAVQGFNEGEGGFGNRVLSAAENATYGALGGAALPAITSAGGALYERVLKSGAVPDALRNFSSAAVDKVARAFGSDAAAGFNYADDIARMTPEGMPLDLRGPNVRAQSNSLAAMPGESGATVQRAVNERAAGAADRIREAADSALGSTAGRQAERQALLAERKSSISPLYDRAAEHAAPLDVREAAAMIDDALLTAAGKKKEALQNIKAQLFNGDVLKSSAAALHEVRSEIGRMARNEYADIAGALRPIQQRLDDQLDTIPGYAEARTRYADSKAIEEAQDAGSKVWGKNARRDEMEAALEGMTEAERGAYRLAARDAAAESMDNAGRTLAQVANDQEAIKGATNLVRSKAGEDKLRALSRTPEAGEAAVRQLHAEEAMAMRNSEIARAAEAGANKRAAQDFPGHSEVGFNRNLAPATPTGLTLAAGDWILRKATFGILDKVRDARALDAAKLYTAADSARDKIVRALVERGLTVRAANEQASEAVRKVTDALMNGKTGSLFANDVIPDDARPLTFAVKPRKATR